MPKQNRTPSDGRGQECRLKPERELAVAASKESPEAGVSGHTCGCRYQIPLNVPIPRAGESCPYLRKGRKFFRARIKDGVLIQLPIKGSKKGTGDVFGPSVCDAKFGCDCPLRVKLEELRKKRRSGAV
jgi:hypothetical protein